MAKQKKSAKSSGGRGSAEAIRKRKVARHLNSIFAGEGGTDSKLDGRTEKRRKRLVVELSKGKDGEALKPMDVVTHVNELLSIGETSASLRKQGVKPRKIELDSARVAAVEEAQAAYKFRSEAWRFLGIEMDESNRVKTGEAPKGKRGPRKKSR
jgi:hypothetical protein